MGDAEMPTLEIEVFGDLICPWCYIGKRRLDRALTMAGDSDLTLIWRPFQLNPAMPERGVNWLEYLNAKFGSAERARQIYDFIRREGEQENIPFAFNKIQHTPNTLSAHGIIRLATRHGKMDEILESLFSAYFVEGRDIGDSITLLMLAQENGIDPDVVQDFLSCISERDAISAEDRAARAQGITGVPHYILGRRFALPGAQPAEVIARAIELARADRTIADERAELT